MKGLIKVMVLVGITIGIGAFWNWADTKDYFRGNYRESSMEEEKIFKWQDGDDGDKLMNRYRTYFSDTSYSFPRQKVNKIKLFKNIPLVGIFTSKTFKKGLNDSILAFLNNPANFDWGETTWSTNESEYYFKLYNASNDVVGKIYLCLNDCGMMKSIPFSPSMKFGGLSPDGMKKIVTLINDNRNWE